MHTDTSNSPLVLVLVLVAVAHVVAASLPGPWQPGRATFYNGWDSGNCGYGNIPTSTFPYAHIAALNTAWYNQSVNCGLCFEVACVQGWLNNLTSCCNKGATLTVLATDQCPDAGWCGGDINHMDLSEVAFALLADKTCGVLKTSYRQVPCPYPYPPTGIVVRQKDGINAYWFALTFLQVNGAGGIAAVEVKDSSPSAAYVTATRTDYNYWIVTSTTGLKPPLSVRVRDQSGQVLEMPRVLTAITPSYDTLTSYQFGTSSGHLSTHAPLPFLLLLVMSTLLKYY